MKMLIWASALALVGGCIAAKTAEIHLVDIVIGTALGALVGSLIGYSFTKLDFRKAQSK